MTQERSISLGDAAGPSGEPQSTIAWAAILAGAVASLAMSLVLSTLVAGFGFKLIAPWPNRPVPGTFTPMLGAGVVAVQVISSALGGYLAGRLRTRWMNLHSHEAHFRDTAHGLLAWAVSTIVGAMLIATVFGAPADSVSVQGAGQIDPVAAANAANIAAQVSFFIGFGLLVSAFTAAVAAALGGMRREEMYEKYWVEEHSVALQR